MSSNAFSIRNARPADAEAIAGVHVASWQAAYRGLIDDDVLDNLSVERRATMWSEWLVKPGPRDALLVAEGDGDVVGFAATGEPGNPPAPEPETTGELHAIYLSPDAWGRGAGRALLERAVEAMRTAGFTDGLLWVLEGNARSRRFYEVAGWKADGGRRSECLPGIRAPAVRYRRAL